MFQEPVHLPEPVENVDLFGEPFTSASVRPPFTPGILNAICDLTILQNEITRYNEEILQPGTEDDLPTRRGLYKKVLAWRESLPRHLLNEVNHTPGTSLLRYVCSGQDIQWVLGLIYAQGALRRGSHLRFKIFAFEDQPRRSHDDD